MEDDKGPQPTIQYQHGSERDGRPGEGQKFYKPFILRTPVLSTLLVVTLVLIGLLELACRRLPDAPNRGVVTSISNGVASLGIRQESGTQSVGEVTIVDGTASDTASSTPTDTIVTPIVPETRSRETTSTQTIDGTTQLVVIRESYGRPCIITSAASCPPGAADDSDWLIVGTRTIPQAVVAGPQTAPDGGGNLVGGGGATQPGDGLAGPATAGGGQQGQADAQATNGATNAATLAGPANTLAVATGTQAGSDPAATALPSAGSDTNAPGVIDASGTITAGASYTPGSTARPTRGSGSNDEGDTANEFADGSSKDLPPGTAYFVFSNAEYFTGAFLPTIIAILFTIPWGFVDNAAKEIEPYVQLAGFNDGGVSARHSLNLDYHSTPIVIMPFKSLFHGHSVVFVAAIMNILALFTAPLAAESIFIGLRGECGAGSNANLCLPTLSIFRKSARVLEGLMGLMALLLIIMIIINRKRSTKVFSDPHSLAATASLFHHPPLLEVFRALPLEIRERKLGQLLNGHSYGTGYYTNQDGTVSYGFLLDPQGPSNPNGVVDYNHIDPNDQSYEKPSTQGWHMTLLRIIQTFILLICLVGLLGVILYYRFVSADSSFERFMNSQGFGVRFMFTTFGVLICQSWYYIRSILHTNEPYQNLTRTSATATSSLLIKPTPIPLLSIFRSLRRFAFLQALIDLCTVLCEVLTVCLANIPYSSANTVVAFRVCVWLATVIIVIMLATLLLVVGQIARLGGGAQVPRTLAGKMRLFVGGTVAERFKDLGISTLEEKQRDRVIVGLEGRYRMGNVRGWDGASRLGVDFEEFVDRE